MKSYRLTGGTCPVDERRTAVYRFYDAAGQLLYVGITFNIGKRFGNHERDAFWWSAQRTVKIAWHDTRVEAAAEEQRAIRVENPLHNVGGFAPARYRAARNAPDAAAQQAIAKAVSFEASCAGLHQRTVGEALGLRLPAMRARLTGEVAFHPVELERLAQFLDVPVAAFLPTTSEVPA